MVMKRRSGRSRLRRVRRRTRRALVRGRPMYSLRPAMPPLSLKRTFYAEYWPFGVASVDNFWRYYTPAMSVLPNLSEYQALFDQYKINGIKITLRPRWTGYDGSNNTTAGTTNEPLQNVHYIIDPLSQITRTGAYSSTTFNSFCEQGNVRSVTGTKVINIYWKPMHNEDAGTGITNAKLVGPRWLSLASATSVVQQGVHIFLQDPNFANAAAGWGYDVFFTYYFQVRGMK